MKRQAIFVGLTVGIVLLVMAGLAAATNFASIGSKLGGIAGSNLIRADKSTAHKTAASQDEGVCLSCHGNMRTDETPWHRMHIQSPFTKFTCDVCHKSIEEGKRSVKGKVMIDRTMCPRCHGQKFAAYTADHQGRDWIKKHKLLKLENKDECNLCHGRKELNFCAECHDSHEAGDQWINGKHGKTAIKTNFECLRCHDKNIWCTGCHEGVTLPHNIPKRSEHWKDEPDAPKWRKTHYLEAERLRAPGEPSYPAGYNSQVKVPVYEKCRRCHDSERSEGIHPDFCMECHHDRFYKENPNLGTPWWKPAMAYVKANGADQCWKCHQPEFCVTCHTTGKKPPRGTTFSGWSD